MSLDIRPKMNRNRSITVAEEISNYGSLARKISIEFSQFMLFRIFSRQTSIDCLSSLFILENLVRQFFV